MRLNRCILTLFLLVGLSLTVAADPKKELQALTDERQKLTKLYYAQGGEESGETPPMVKLAPRYQQFEKRYRGTEPGLEALFTLITGYQVPRETSKAALELVKTSYRDHPALGKRLVGFQYWQGGPSGLLLDEVRAHSKLPENRAYAAFTLGSPSSGEQRVR